jgi:hypothetical protein
MPELKTSYYVLTGPATVLIYTEQEMAQALSISVSELHHAIERGFLSYHAHPQATGEGYWFNESSYTGNISRYQCLVSGGHFWRWDHFYDKQLAKSVYVCPCGAEKFD